MALDQQMIELSAYRLERAAELVDTAAREMDAEDYLTAANRSYYAFFSAIRAVLALDGLDFKKHSAVISKFRELYIKTNVFDVSYSEMIRDAFDVRNNSDYEDFYMISREDVKQQIDNAADFVSAVRVYLAKRITSE